MDTQHSLANHVLVAMPSMMNPIYSHAVIYICEHHDQGSVGLMINKPLDYSLNFIFEQLAIKPSHPNQGDRPLLLGGPMQPERGFVIHRPGGEWRSSLLLLANEVTITTSSDIIRAIADDHAPKDILVTLGYVGWGSNQLEQEILENVWLVCPYEPALLYEISFEKRWEYAGKLIGVNMNQIISGEGHA